MRDFETLEAVPEATFGAFKEVRLQAKPSQPPPAPFSPDPRERLPIVFTAREREEIIGHLLGRDISTVILTPTQKQAIIQENELREQGFSPFSPASDSKQSTQLQQTFPSKNPGPKLL